MRCVSCTEDNAFFDAARQQCFDCPSLANRLGILVGSVAGFALLGCFFYWLWRRARDSRSPLVRARVAQIFVWLSLLNINAVAQRESNSHFSHLPTR